MEGIVHVYASVCVCVCVYVCVDLTVQTSTLYYNASYIYNLKISSSHIKKVKRKSEMTFNNIFYLTSIFNILFNEFL